MWGPLKNLLSEIRLYLSTRQENSRSLNIFAESGKYALYSPSRVNGFLWCWLPSHHSSLLLCLSSLSTCISSVTAATAKSLQSCPTLCDPIEGSLPGSPVPGILQARTLEWVVISFSNAWKWKVKVKSLSHVRPSATPWTAAYHAPPSMGFSRQEYWSGVPLPSPTVVYNSQSYFSVLENLRSISWTFNECFLSMRKQ